jgi:leucyl aminopeptidase
LAWDKLVVVGTAPKKASDPALTAVNLGGQIMGRIGKSGNISIVLDRDPGQNAAGAADLAMGLRLRAYDFDRYKTKSKDKDGEDESKKDESKKAQQIALHVADPAGCRAAWASAEAIAKGVITARDLVNEPPNVLYPEEFANRAAALKALGVEVEILDKKALTDLKMGALLGVAQGSIRDPRVVIMRWNGGKPGDAPVAFVGKGVCFDSGGISIKPAGGMEDMKGDMGGAACVVGLMEALAGRKAKCNAVGAIGLVENMPDGAAQRPGDIVTTMSGQTIEIVNTDAEGRLVLADVLWHVQTSCKPRYMIDLATLTGAIMVALGQEYTGLFSNDDALAEALRKAGEATGERVWRMPLGPYYEKQNESKFADMKNSGGRYGGSSTAAQLLSNFVGETTWAHLDIAGTAMGSPASDINRSWGSGWGVRILDQFTRDCVEG